jgi:uncharacterized protein
MTVSEILLIAGAGIAGGAMNSIAGGGTIVTFPALIFAGLNPIVANATSTVALMPGSIASLVAYRRNFGALRFWLLVFGPSCLLGGLLGSMLLVYTPDQTFEQLVPLLLLFATGLFMAKEGIQKTFLPGAAVEARSRSFTWIAAAAAFQFLVGIYGGYFGAGIGILMLASYGILGFQHIHRMNTLKLVLGAVINGTASVYFICTLPIAWQHAGILAIGTILGGYGGAAVAQKIPDKAVRVMIAVIGLSLSAAIFWKK